LLEIQTQIEKLVNEDAQKLQLIEDQTNQTEYLTETGVIDIADSARLVGKNRTIKMAAGGVTVGAAVGCVVGIIGGPVGMAAGSAGGAALFGMIGGGIGKVMDWQQNKFIDNELMELEHQKKFMNANYCQKCTSAFTTFKLRHHCRICGGSFCSDCSQSRIDYQYKGIQNTRKVRVCDACFKNYTSTH